MQYEGDVYRPPMEARSLIIQVTIGCSYNQCTFCHMYVAKTFRIRKREEVLADLEECSRQYGPQVRRVFFADGDALVAPTELLLELLSYVQAHFPGAERVTAYGSARDVLRKSETELFRLMTAGLGMVYLGAESGDDAVLQAIKKGETAAEILEAGRKLKRCGIQTSLSLISGLGGRTGMKDHAVKTAELINAMNPEYVTMHTLHLTPDSPMQKEIARGERVLLTPDEIMDETELMLQRINSPGTIFLSNHDSNYVLLAGVCNRDIPEMLKQLREARENHWYHIPGSQHRRAAGFFR